MEGAIIVEKPNVKWSDVAGLEVVNFILWIYIDMGSSWLGFISITAKVNFWLSSGFFVLVE